MDETDFHLVQPPFAQLDEALWWIEFKQIEDAKRDGWSSTLESANRLEAALLRGELVGYGSLDAGPVQLIEKWTWTEFEFVPADRDGRRIEKKVDYIPQFIVRSSKAYRAETLKDLSQPANKPVPGIEGNEPEFHRVLSQIVFFESEVREAFPAGFAKRKNDPPLDRKYAKLLRAIEGGKYLYSPEPEGFDHVFGLLINYLENTRQLNSADSSIRKGLQRHYTEVNNRYGQ
ncbi:hypothetical protein C2U70_01605 [Bradyrhizobium guangdongense]|uniref:hypothetical protein n=1 Tax=Bradyrhizobium guangdongense TaxID=1325090 RepID=UPI00112CE980|nr:hypothetical protein [Bradyrhizobium guangdongense]TPQ42382.1 hypothetical protein C2U70_01605 [Bradyrhizobium guangdongense]